MQLCIERWPHRVVGPPLRCLRGVAAYQRNAARSLEGINHIHAGCVTAQALTYGPFRPLAVRVCLPHQFAVHSPETLDCIRYVIGNFEIIAESTINRESRGCKLQTNGVSSPRRCSKRRYSHCERQARHLSTNRLSILISPTPSRAVWGMLNGGMCQHRFRGWRHRCKKSVAKC